MAVSVACMAIYLPTPGFKGRPFKLCVLTRWDFNFYVRSSLLQDLLSVTYQESSNQPEQKATRNTNGDVLPVIWGLVILPGAIFAFDWASDVKNHSSISIQGGYTFSKILFLFLHFTAVLSQWDFSHGKFGLSFPGKASSGRVALLNLGCMPGVLVLP